MSNIPLIIHQIWWQGYKNLPNEYLIYRNSWILKHPNWKLIFWDKEKIEKFIININKDLCEILYKLPYMIQKIDFSKYIILYYYGGVYVDMDTICEEKLDYLLVKYKHGLILSKIDIYDNYKLINNGIIISEKYHEFFLYLYYEIAKNLKKKFYENKDLYILNSTGPIVFSKAVLNYLLNSKKKNIKILDSYYLESCKMSELGDCKNSGKYITHIHKGSWQSIFFKLHFYIIKFYNKYNNYIYILIILKIILISIILIK